MRPNQRDNKTPYLVRYVFYLRNLIPHKVVINSLIIENIQLKRKREPDSSCVDYLYLSGALRKPTVSLLLHVQIKMDTTSIYFQKFLEPLIYVGVFIANPDHGARMRRYIWIYTVLKCPKDRGFPTVVVDWFVISDLIHIAKAILL